MKPQAPAAIARPPRTRRLAPLWLPMACVLALQAPARAAEPATTRTAEPATTRMDEPATTRAAEPAPTRAAEPAPLVDAGVAPADEALDLTDLPWRHGQLQLHQGFGLATLASMAATGGLGYWLSRQNGTSGVFDGHLLMAGLTTGLYLTAGTLALTAPPSPLARQEGPWESTALHRKLGWLHAAGLATTVGCGLLATYGSLSYSQPHGLAGYTTLGLMALSAGVIAFGQ